MYASSISYRTASEINSAMGRVYGHMALAVITSMIVSYLVGSTPALVTFFFTGITKWIVIFSPLLAVFVVGWILGQEGLAKGVYQLALHGFAALMGLSFATIFAVFTIGSIINAFIGAAVLFGVLSFYGYFTKKSLTGIGQLCIVGLIAIIFASIINLILASFWPGIVDNSLVGQVISAIAIIIFLGLTAYDTQRIREELSMATSDAAEVRGALSLYLDFINLFISLVQLFGSRKE
jgi:FtsH-binding integral membrane protein